MAEYIERESAFELVTDLAGQASTKTAYSAFWKSANTLKEMPAADVVEVRHGEWEKDPIAIRDDGEIYDYRCSVCTARAHKGENGNYDYFTSYCPNCGAKMDGKGEGE